MTVASAAAVAAASSLFTPFVPISKRASPRGFISSPSLYNPLSLPSPISPSSPRLPCSRKTRRVRARILQEKDEKVRVEDSFRVGTSPVDGAKIADDIPPTTTPGTVERWVIKVEQSLNVLLVESVIVILDALYKDRNYPRFYVLETIARVPYFAFISVLHLYESFGWWRKSEYLKVHFAESWNELHHLLIMEELGGNAFWFDRFLAQHMAVFYYFMTVAMYALSPRMAYHFSECVEKHAFSTYDKFLKLKGEELKKQPAPEVAIKYYMSEDMYMFDEFQTDRVPRTRRPIIENLYDVFVNIRDDEAEHCKTMKACQTPGNLQSPHSVDLRPQEDDEVPVAACEGVVDSVNVSTPRT